MLAFENQVILGDCLKVLRQLPDATYDSCVVDPPYGLGDEPAPEEIVAYLQGADLVTGDFMNKDWDIPSVLVWREVFRILKPGGHVLSFGGTRTWDLISLGLRAAGFEKRDTIADDHPGLQWVQSQGMPKSTNISKQLQKLKHPQALEFQGLGTGLKPTWEPILVFRKPLSEKNLALNVLKHGTGGINIDATRVRHASPEDLAQHKAGVDAIKARGGSMADSWKNSSDLSGANEVTSAGRWPSNFLLTHAEGCKNVGPHRFKGSATSKTFHAAYEGESTTGFIRGHSHPGNQHGDADGLETADSWQCVEGCPAAALNAQSGNRKSTLAGLADPNQVHEHPGIDTTSKSMWFGKDRKFLGNVYADQGGAARFYPQFEGQEPVEAPFLYTGKATKRETTLGGRIVNKHPTRKPLALMRWLVKLVTPKGGLTIDPYCGSGSTLHAAIEEGVRFTGIERDPEFHETSRQRVEAVQRMGQEIAEDTSVFELAMSASNKEDS